jgi:hypothetical protein
LFDVAVLVGELLVVEIPVELADELVPDVVVLDADVVDEDVVVVVVLTTAATLRL